MLLKSSSLSRAVLPLDNRRLPLVQFKVSQHPESDGSEHSATIRKKSLPPPPRRESSVATCPHELSASTCHSCGDTRCDMPTTGRIQLGMQFSTRQFCTASEHDVDTKKHRRFESEFWKGYPGTIFPVCGGERGCRPIHLGTRCYPEQLPQPAEVLCSQLKFTQYLRVDLTF